MGTKIERKCCINCSADLTLTSTKNKSAFYNLNCSSRVKSPLSPASFELIPVHRALATIYNFETVEKVSKVSVEDHIDTDRESSVDNESRPFKKFQSAVSTVPICYVCYLVLSDLYRNYTEFAQLRNSDSFLGSKLQEMENQLSAHRSQQPQESSSTSGSIPKPNEVPDSIQDCKFNRTDTLENLEAQETSTGTKTRASVNSEFTTPKDGHDRANINLLSRSTKLKRPRDTSGDRPSQGKHLLVSVNLDEAVAVEADMPPLQTKNVEIPDVKVHETESTDRKGKGKSKATFTPPASQASAPQAKGKGKQQKKNQNQNQSKQPSLQRQQMSPSRQKPRHTATLQQKFPIFSPEVGRPVAIAAGRHGTQPILAGPSLTGMVIGAPTTAPLPDVSTLNISSGAVVQNEDGTYVDLSQLGTGDHNFLLMTEDGSIIDPSTYGGDLQQFFNSQ